MRKAPPEVTIKWVLENYPLTAIAGAVGSIVYIAAVVTSRERLPAFYVAGDKRYCHRARKLGMNATAALVAHLSADYQLCTLFSISTPFIMTSNKSYPWSASKARVAACVNTLGNGPSRTIGRPVHSGIDMIEVAKN